MDNATTYIKPDMMVNALLNLHVQAAEIFLRHGMACVGCPLSSFHTLAESAVIYGQDPVAFLAELRTCVDSQVSPSSDETSHSSDSY